MKARKKSTSSQPTESGTVDFIGAWASAHEQSSHLHILPTPIDIGDKDQALCGVVPAIVWTESKVPETYYCHTCLVRFQQMYSEDDRRLSPADRSEWRRIENEYRAQR